jgi:hypothetical protein
MQPAFSEGQEVFDCSRSEFDSVVAELSSAEVLQMTHSQVESLLHTRGLELVRQLLQDHLDLRAPGLVVGGQVVGGDGVVRTHVTLGGRALGSIFGQVRVSRAGYGKPGCERLHPLDGELNLPMGLYSHGVQRRVAEEASRGSYDETVASLRRATGAAVAKRQALRLVILAATDFDAFYQARNSSMAEAAGPTGGILVISADGKGIVMRKKDLREATRLAAERRNHKMNKRLSTGEKKNSKRMATVATVYTIRPFRRSPSDVVRELQAVQDVRLRAQRPRPENKRVWASLEKEPEDVLQDAFEEAQRRDPSHSKRWVALVDGNKTQLRLLREQAARLGVELTIILDLIHVIEYLWKAVTAFHSAGTKDAEAWVTERIVRILHGQASQVAAGIRRSATLRGISGAKRKPVDICARYLLKHAPYLRYDEYLAEGLPIATGVIEGACRHLIKDRLDITGARWGLDGAEAVLKIRSLRSSGDFDEYWTFHEARDLERNHSSHFQNKVIPKTAGLARCRC